ncbi:MAG: nuclear transport factor 2 family protein [Steroidobacteraceae bacterium]
MSAPSPLELTHRWLKVLGDADYDAWATLTSSDLVIKTPYAPPGLPKATEGRETCLKMARQYGELLKKFEYLDVELHTTDDPELIMGTAHSEALTASGHRYANQYCVLARVRNAKIVEYTEYFDPQRVVAAAEAEGMR